MTDRIAELEALVKEQDAELTILRRTLTDAGLKVQELERIKYMSPTGAQLRCRKCGEMADITFTYGKPS